MTFSCDLTLQIGPLLGLLCLIKKQDFRPNQSVRSLTLLVSLHYLFNSLLSQWIGNRLGFLALSLASAISTSLSIIINCDTIANRAQGPLVLGAVHICSKRQTLPQRTYSLNSQDRKEGAISLFCRSERWGTDEGYFQRCKEELGIQLRLKTPFVPLKTSLIEMKWFTQGLAESVIDLGTGPGSPAVQYRDRATYSLFHTHVGWYAA